MASRQHVPEEATVRTAGTVHSTIVAATVPESAADIHCAVVVVDRVTVGPRVIVTVVRGEHVLVAAERIIGVTRVPGHTKGVVGLFRQHQERTVLGVVPAVIST